ncbi:hypothetical protein D0C16_24055 [Cellvibrio sp. KY-GH-1]|uniref:hypothetical protein n=1 Tax=Cellvibrio sp. KY-GH-1 TaxID=2303332 RepID=UPI00124833D4|nr:hypothetical protein [Cellvibrio sp. KY-GH-1]QEY18786.1 hypothetical protein D0C16_24055 [Cellvibrio sp. KY-GH-1]
MTRTHLHYEITNADIGHEFVKLGIVIPLSFMVVGGAIMYYGKGSIDPAARYFVPGMVIIGFLLLQGIAWWHFRHPNYHEFTITDERVEHRTQTGGFNLLLSDIQKIVTSRVIGSNSSRIDYFLKTKTGERFSIPKLHKLPDGKIIKILLEVNPSILKE